jgi:Domain of unknown function (DUF1877)
MSIVTYYARLSSGQLDELRRLQNSPESAFELLPACVFTPEEASALSKQLAAVTEEMLRQIQPVHGLEVQMAAVENWVEDGEELFEGYILPHFENLKRLYATAAEAGQYVVVFNH